MKKNIFFEREFFEEKFLQPQFFFHPPILNTKNEIYIEVWHFLVRPTDNGKLPKTRLESRRKSPAHLGLRVHITRSTIDTGKLDLLDRGKQDLQNCKQT